MFTLKLPNAIDSRYPMIVGSAFIFLCCLPMVTLDSSSSPSMDVSESLDPTNFVTHDMLFVPTGYQAIKPRN